MSKRRLSQHKTIPASQVVLLNVYTHLGLEDATEELRKIEAFRKAQAEVSKPVKQSAFKVV